MKQEIHLQSHLAIIIYLKLNSCVKYQSGIFPLTDQLILKEILPNVYKNKPNHKNYC